MVLNRRMKKLLCAFILMATSTWAVPVKFKDVSTRFRYRLQDRNQWWGCHSAEPIMRDFLYFMGATRVYINCYDYNRIPEVDMDIRFESLELASEDNRDIEAYWKSFFLSRNRYCGYHLAMIEELSQHFIVRGGSLNAYCYGEDGTITYQGEQLTSH